MRYIKSSIFAAIFMLLAGSMQICLAAANTERYIDMTVKEYTAYVGSIWPGFNDPAITNLRYEIEDTDIAQFYNQNGVRVIRFTAPGRAVVRAYLRYYGNDFEYKFIFNIKDVNNFQNIKESASDKNYKSPAGRDYAQQMLNLVNAERAKAGVKPLVLDNDLNRAADIRAKEAVQKFSHTRPDGTHFSTVLDKRIAKRAGENLSAGEPTVKEAVDGWMNSPGHKRNILDARYKSMGVGYCYDADSEYLHYWVQIFLL